MTLQWWDGLGGRCPNCQTRQGRWQRGEGGKPWAGSHAAAGRLHDLSTGSRAFLTPNGAGVGQPEGLGISWSAAIRLPRAWNQAVAQELSLLLVLDFILGQLGGFEGA